MCLSDIQTIKSILGDSAIVGSGRTVRLGHLAGEVLVGDDIEVYADIAIQKMSKQDSDAIHASRKDIL